jgi:preprotein translocase subunit Sec61beta
VSILERLDRKEKIFSVVVEAGGLRFYEECDRYYNCLLTPMEVQKLAAELIALADEVRP